MQDETPILEKVGETFGFAQQYVKKRIELYRLEFTEWAVTTIANLLTSLFLLSLFFLIILFGSLSVGFYLSEALGSFGLGFLIVTYAYVLIAILLVIFKRPLVLNPILRKVIDRLKNNDS